MSISKVSTRLWLWLLLAHHHRLTIAAVNLLLLGLRYLAAVVESLSGDHHGLRCWHAVALNHWLARHRLSISTSQGRRGHLHETTLRLLHHLLRLLLHHHLLRRWLLHHLSGCCLLLHHVLLRWLLGHLRLWLVCVIGLLHRWLLLVRHHLLLDHRLAWGGWNVSQVHVVALDVVDMPAQARTESQN